MTAEITIVVPARNRADILPRTLASIRAQQLRPLKVVLVDNGSSDATMAVMQQWADEVNAADPAMAVTVLSEPRLGSSPARNAGLAIVDTPWTLFFDSDDEMLPSHCAEMLAAAHASPDADIVGRPVSLNLLHGRHRIGKYGTHNPFWAHMFHATLATTRYIGRTALFRAAGGWEPHAWGWNDYELGLRLLLLNPRMATAPGRPTVVVHSQVDSITGVDFSSSPTKWENTLNICDAHISECAALSPATAAALHTMIDARRLILSAHYHAEGSVGEARRLLKATLKGQPLWRSLRYRLIWLQNRVMKRGSAQLTAILFPSTNI